MILKHIALSVKKQDIENFYEKVLGFEVNNSFNLRKNIVETIFGIAKDVELYYMKNDSIELELFVYPETFPSTFNHICLEYPEAQSIFLKAKENGYYHYHYVREKKGNDTYFIKDTLGNMFEIK